MTKNIIYSIFGVSSLLLFSGCCSSKMVALSNGYNYYGNSCSCAKSRLLSDGVTLQCYDRKGNYTGSLRPLAPNQVAQVRHNQNIRVQQDAARRAERNQRAQQTNQMMQNTLNNYSGYTSNRSSGGYKTYDAYGNLRNSNDCYTTRDAYGRYVKTCR